MVASECAKKYPEKQQGWQTSAVAMNLFD